MQASCDLIFTVRDFGALDCPGLDLDRDRAIQAVESIEVVPGMASVIPCTSWRVGRRRCD
jgi:hypothetical protein